MSTPPPLLFLAPCPLLFAPCALLVAPSSLLLTPSSVLRRLDVFKVGLLGEARDNKIFVSQCVCGACSFRMLCAWRSLVMSNAGENTCFFDYIQVSNFLASDVFTVVLLQEAREKQFVSKCVCRTFTFRTLCEWRSLKRSKPSNFLPCDFGARDVFEVGYRNWGRRAKNEPTIRGSMRLAHFQFSHAFVNGGHS